MAKIVSPSFNRVFVQTQDNSDILTISFRLTLNGTSKHFNLQRNRDEYLCMTLERIRANILKMAANKKLKHIQKRDPAVQEELDIILYGNDSPIDPLGIRNIDAWVDGAKLQIGDQFFHVGKNQPLVSQMKLPSPILSGFLTIPLVTLSNCQLGTSKFEWFRRISSKDRSDMLESEPTSTKNITLESGLYWLKLADTFTYSPIDEDIAYYLRCSCEPIDKDSNSGQPFSITSSGPVEIGPKSCPFMERHRSTTNKFQKDDDRFRLVTYNILADLYADSNHSRTVLFAHCPPYALDVDYRRQLLMRELQGYNADIVCMQEVDRKEFTRAYEPFFNLTMNHKGVFHTKGGQVAEGVATFFDEDRFELVESHRTVLNQLIDPFSEDRLRKPTGDTPGESSMNARDGKKEDVIEGTPIQENNHPHPILDNQHSTDAIELLSRFDSIRSRISINPLLHKRFTDRHTILQTTLLKVKGGMKNRFLIISNTHLYFAPDADHIRLLQGCVCVKYLEFIREYYAKLINKNFSINNPKLSIILCGDMNSSPDCGIHMLLQDGSIGPELKDWKSNISEEVTELSLTTRLRFSSAYRDVPYTNYTPDFNGCLDYIYYEIDSIALDRTIPLPKHEDVTAIGGIPSETFPSDHIALVADLKFTS